MSVESIINDIIKREGSFVDHPDDKGGPTKYGITLATLSSWRQSKNLTAADVQGLTEAEARLIYRAKYILEPGFDIVTDEALKELLVDCAVLHGPGRAVKWLQHALGVAEDGVIGSQTKARIATVDARALRARIVATRVRTFGRIITDSPGQAVFAAGWLNRAAEFIEALA